MLEIVKASNSMIQLTINTKESPHIQENKNIFTQAVNQKITELENLLVEKSKAFLNTKDLKIRQHLTTSKFHTMMETITRFHDAML